MTGGEGAENSTFNRPQFLWMVQGLDGFKRLAGDIGKSNAKTIAEQIYENQVRDSNPAERYIEIATGERPQFTAAIDTLLQTEFSQIREQRAHAAALLEMANGSRLRGALVATAEDEADYLQSIDLPAPGSPEHEVAKADGWISHSMHGDTRHLTREVLTHHILAAPSGPALGETLQILDQVHAALVPDAPRVRSPNSDVAYPSSTGGRFLLGQIFQWTATADWPARGDERWMDIALYYLGAIASAQGYTDGNKRVARMGYAITLLKGGCPFVAPGQVMEKALICMHRAEQKTT